MNQTKPLTTLIKAFGSPGDAPTYDEDRKKRYHNLGRRYLRELAKDLNLDKGNYDIRVCAGGIAVPGEVTLHSDDLYVQIHFSYTGDGLSLMIRGVRHRKDYTGFVNQFVRLTSGCEDEVLHTCRGAARMAQIRKEAGE